MAICAVQTVIKTHASMNILNSSQEEVVAKLVAEGIRRLNAPTQKAYLPGAPDDRDPLEDFKNYPHLFVFSCVMDRQMKTEKVWLIPYKIGEITGGLEFERFLNLSLAELTEIFNAKKLHRFNNDMAKCFYDAVQQIHSEYKDHAENIWANNPKSANVIRRFLEFNGVGIKIANMAANILTRDFKVPMQERSSIDIAPDVQVMKYFKNHGLLSKQS